MVTGATVKHHDGERNCDSSAGSLRQFRWGALVESSGHFLYTFILKSLVFRKNAHIMVVVVDLINVGFTEVVPHIMVMV